MATTDRPAPPHVERIFDIDPGRSSRLTLPNGVTLWVCGDRPQEDVVRLDMMLRGGRWHQRHLLQAGYTNRMLQEGTRRHTAREVAEAFDYHGAWTDFSCSMLHSYATLYCMAAAGETSEGFLFVDRGAATVTEGTSCEITFAAVDRDENVLATYEVTL